MVSIPKTVLTPIKWASRQILHHTLLRFPGGEEHTPVACVYCPEMCRFSCPTSVSSGDDTVTPCNKMGLYYKEQQWPGKASQGNPLWPVYDCTGCGRCTEYCVYEMPVADFLWQARKEHSWEQAKKVSDLISDHEDPCGALAEELGQEKLAQRRLSQWVEKSSYSKPKRKAAVSVDNSVDEPHALYFLEKNSLSAELPWVRNLNRKIQNQDWAELRAVAAGKNWLVHESVWLNRRLKKTEEVQKWINSLSRSGVNFILPFAHGKDCIDCGGEGAFHRLFPEQAKQMALDFWERDRHRADGILCFSKSCGDHFRRTLGNEVKVISLAEIFQTQGGSEE